MASSKKQNSAKKQESPKRKERDEDVVPPTKRRYVPISKKSRLSKAISKRQTAITINVGPEKEPWVLLKESLCLQSAYFDRAFNGYFQEAVSKEVTLEHVDPEIFAIFSHWLLSNQLGIDEMLSNPSPEGIQKEVNAHFDTLVSCWLLGDYFQAPAFQNEAMKFIINTKISLITKAEQLPTAAFRTIYEETVDDSPLQCWAHDLWLRLPFTVVDFNKPLEVFPQKMLLDLLITAEGESKNIQAIAAKKAGFFDFNMELPALNLGNYLVEEFKH